MRNFELNLNDSKNVGKNERYLSTVLGSVFGALALNQLVKKKWPEAFLSFVSAAAMVHRGASGKCPIYKAIGMSTLEDDAFQGIRVEEDIIIENTPAELYQYCRKVENLPQVIRHLKTVTSLDPKKSHWVAEAESGVDLAWDMEISQDKENSFIEWKAVGNSQLQAVASISFEELADELSTRVKINLEYTGAHKENTLALMKFFARDVKNEMIDDLEIFKHYMESGAFPWDETKSPTVGTTLQTH